MGNLLKGLLGRVVMGAVGLVAALAWFSWSGGGGDYKSMAHMPDAVFGGGAGKITVEFDSNQPAVLKASFEQWDEESEESEGIHVIQNVKPGWSARSVDMAEGTSIYFELGVPDAKVGATLDFKVLLDGKEIYSEKSSLTKPLTGGQAFFAQFEANDMEELRYWRDNG